jgi:hypothetical protein
MSDEIRKIDHAWAQEQLEKVGIDKDTWVKLNELIETWNDQEFDDAKADAALEFFAELAQGHSLLPEESEEVWMEAIRGSVHTGDVVRVLHDAYEGRMGQYHNGRIGKVVGVRNGMIFFRSTDDIHPQIDGASYPFDKLQLRVQ